MKFDKCHVLHIRTDNTFTNDSIKDVQLQSIDKQNDFDIIITGDLKLSSQWTRVIKTCNFNSDKVILTLYNSLVCSHLEYCVQLCSPLFKKDVDKLVTIQHHIIKIIPILPNKP